ncbi:unnamed protein product [Gadus morhua 'NCC']
MINENLQDPSRTMSGGEVIFQGWLRKSPPEKKLRRYAWKKRWFILRSGRMSGDPDVLEYYKNDHSKKPIRVIDLHCCEQVDAGLTFKRKEFQDSFVFDIKTSDRTFYLVAETEDEMNKWVRSICQLCGFNQSDDNHDGRSAHTPRTSDLQNSTAASSSAPLSERKPSAPVHSSQPVLFTFDVPLRHGHHGSLSNSAPQDYLLLHQCMSRKSESARSASFSQSTRSSLFMSSDSAVQKLSHGLSHCLNGTGAHLQGFYSLPKPGKPHLAAHHHHHDPAGEEACYVLPRSYGSDATALDLERDEDEDEEEVYTFKTPCNALAAAGPSAHGERSLGQLRPAHHAGLLLPDPARLRQEPQLADAVQLRVVVVRGGPAAAASPQAQPGVRQPVGEPEVGGQPERGGAGQRRVGDTAAEHAARRGERQAAPRLLL